MNKVPITVRGAQKLQDELLQLKTVDRPKVIDAIATAREHGDLKENAEYHAAREQQGFIEGRIKDIEGSWVTPRSSMSPRSMLTARWFLVPRSMWQMKRRVTS